ncbi:hypothetical protein AJ80_08013 [Polytolypa hystricis UAMH7299]|uniref:Uncharacterized protein n=1 Tax=Polytolypa hystricis (strain UAMH7299) TaxID=1447883 RepID=A0A2B7XF71_POLH7|nr:hypothetical protein AJ80_08013 [Polytolypa hystricis UAMH7299]
MGTRLPGLLKRAAKAQAKEMLHTRIGSEEHDKLDLEDQAGQERRKGEWGNNLKDDGTNVEGGMGACGWDGRGQLADGGVRCIAGCWSKMASIFGRNNTAQQRSLDVLLGRNRYGKVHAIPVEDRKYLSTGAGCISTRADQERTITEKRDGATGGWETHDVEVSKGGRGHW